MIELQYNNVGDEYIIMSATKSDGDTVEVCTL